jgi:RNA polymerase sigma-70 factor (ECF subfamily)
MTDRTGHIEDELLVLRCQGGDSEAFDALVRRWHARLWRHALRLTGSPEAAGDVVQETWAGVIRGLASLRIPSTFPGWVYRIATNKSRDWLRKQVRDRRLEGALTERGAPEPSNGASFSKAEATLEEALQELPGESRALLDLYYVQGFDVREVAEILSVPPGTVKSRLARVREALRRRMEDLSDAERR